MSIHAHGPLRWFVRRLAVGGLGVSCLARARGLSIASNMKRDASLAHSPPKPARVVYVRLSQADTQIDLHTPDPRLSQATTLTASTPLDLDYPGSQGPAWLPAGLLALPLARLLLLTRPLTVLLQCLSPRFSAPLVVTSDDWEREYAISGGRPHPRTAPHGGRHHLGARWRGWR